MDMENKRVKEAKRHGEMRRHAVCGSCSRTVKIRNEKDKVACTSSLEIMPADHVSDCEDYLPVVANDVVSVHEDRVAK